MLVMVRRETAKSEFFATRESLCVRGLREERDGRDDLKTGVFGASNPDLRLPDRACRARLTWLAHNSRVARKRRLSRLQQKCSRIIPVRGFTGGFPSVIERQARHSSRAAPLASTRS